MFKSLPERVKFSVKLLGCISNSRGYSNWLPSRAVAMAVECFSGTDFSQEQLSVRFDGSQVIRINGNFGYAHGTLTAPQPEQRSGKYRLNAVLI